MPAYLSTEVVDAQASLPIGPRGIDLSTDLALRSSFSSDLDLTGVLPQAIMYPRNTEQVQAVIRWANDHRLSLVPVSSRSTERRHGDTVPLRAGVVMDMRVMDRLLNASQSDKIAVIEPGVSFGTIDALLAPHGLRSYKPLRPHAGKSVLTAFLERQPMTVPDEHWDVADPLGGMEMILGNGELFRTGGAASPLSMEEQWDRGNRFLFGYGPVYTDYQRVVQGSQGTLGVVTASALICQAIPVSEKAWVVGAERLEPLIEVAYEALHTRLGCELFIVNAAQLALLMSDTKLPGLGSTRFNSLIEKMPAWCLFITLTADHNFPCEKMDWQEQRLAQVAAKYGLIAAQQVAELRAQELHAVLHRPSEVRYQDHGLGAHQSLFFLHQLDKADQHVESVKHIMRTQSEGNLLGVYIQPTTQGSNCHIEFTFPHHRSATALRLAHDSQWRSAQICAANGGFFSRPYGSWEELAFKNDPGLRDFLRMTKSILDPVGVLNPGRLYSEPNSGV